MENLTEKMSDETQIHIKAFWDDGKSSQMEEVGPYVTGQVFQVDSLVSKVVESLKKEGFEILSEFTHNLDGNDPDGFDYVQYSASAKRGDEKGTLDVMIVLDEQDSFHDLIKKELPKFESIQDVKARIKVLREQFEMFDQPVMGEADEEDEVDSETIDYENKLTDDVLEKFVEGLLTKLGELEVLGQVPPIESPMQAKKALLAVIRSLNLRKGIVNKMGRKFARLGAKQFLRRQRRELSHSLTQS